MKQPKEKAIELVEKYGELAELVVRDILSTFIDIDPKKDYWQEVKRELKKLKQ